MAQYQDAIKAHTAQAARLGEFEMAHIALQRQIQQIKNEKDAQIQSLKLQLKYVPSADSAASVREMQLAAELAEVKKTAEHWESQYRVAMAETHQWQLRHQFVTEDLQKLQVEYQTAQGEMEHCQIILQEMSEQHRQAVQEAEMHQEELQKQRTEIVQLMEGLSKCERAAALRETEVDSLNQQLQEAHNEKGKLSTEHSVGGTDAAKEDLQLTSGGSVQLPAGEGATEPRQARPGQGSSITARVVPEPVGAQDVRRVTIPTVKSQVFDRSVSPGFNRSISFLPTVTVPESPLLRQRRKCSPTRVTSPASSPPVVNRTIMSISAPLGEATAHSLSLQRKSSPARVVSPMPSPPTQNRTIRAESLSRENTPSMVLSQVIDSALSSASTVAPASVHSPPSTAASVHSPPTINRAIQPLPAVPPYSNIVAGPPRNGPGTVQQLVQWYSGSPNSQHASRGKLMNV